MTEIQQGYILTSHWKDRSNQLDLEFYGKTNKGPFKLVFKEQKIVFFIQTESDFKPYNFKFERKSGGLKSFSHAAVDTVYVQTYKDLLLARDYCQQNSIRSFELDILPTERFLMERFINAEIEFSGEAIVKNGIEVYTNPQIRPAQTNISLSNLSLDIETGVNGELYSIGLHFENSHQQETNKQDIKQIVYMLNTQIKSETERHSDTLIYCKNEKVILIEFQKTLQKWDPDLIIGWHVVGFDFMFLEKKFNKFGVDFAIGRQNKILTLNERKGVGFFANTSGRVILDGPPILRSAFYKFNNFKLDTVASEVLGVGKDIASDGGKVTEIERRFKEDKPALAKYNLLDCSLVTDIFKKLDIFNLLIQRTKISGLLIDRLPVSTAAFDHAFLPRLHRKGFVAPNRIDISREDQSTGGLVIEPKAGLHKDVAVFDFKSLYPSIIMTFKIDPYSKIQSGIDTINTPKGYFFSSTEHILPEIIKTLMERRQWAKDENNQPLSQAVKILMNSFYGVMGSSRCRFYHSDLPTAITTTGQWILRQAIDFFENRGLKVIYGDTDSIFVKLKESDDEFCQGITGELDLYLRKLIADEFKVNSFLECEFETCFNKIFFSQTRSGEGAAKKRYAGMAKGEIEFKGMEFVRSDWTDLAKAFQKEIFEKFFSDDELEQYIKGYIKRLENGDFDDSLVYTKRLSKAPEEYTKNVPVHVKAALKIIHTGPYRLKEVSYIITKTGPEPITDESQPKYQRGGSLTHTIDYQHYIEKQLKPIADDVLQTLDMSFDSFILGDQLTLF